jgi:hypothetical protein
MTLRPDPDLCTRWVADRVIDLGWSKEQFGQQDVPRSYGEQVTERIAKKYERIAFQELCGHLTDHCLVDERWRGAPEPYDGPWQIYETLDVDPSLLVRGDEPETDTPAARLRGIRLRAESEKTWWRTYLDHELTTTGDDDDWLSDTSDIPRPEALLRAVDPAGREWLAVERHQQWTYKDPEDLEPGHSRDRRMMWFRSQANIIRADETRLPVWAAGQNWMGLRDVSTPQDVWMACLGEYPDLQPWPSLLHQGDKERRPYDVEDDPGYDVLPLGWEYARIDAEIRAPYAIATVGWHQESGKDFAAGDTPGACMPSRILLDLLNAHWSGRNLDSSGLGLGPVENEYSWAADGQVVAFCAAGRGYGSGQALWVRAEAIRKALRRSNLAMWSWTLSEKIYWRGHEPSSNRTDSYGAVGLAPEAVAVWGYTIERDHDRGRGGSGRRERVYAERH